MKKNNLVSIITVNWNGKKWLKKCLNSLEKQTYKNIEIIVVDNGSTDGSVNYIKKLFPKIRIVVNNNNLGLAKATNIGVDNCSGEFILFINNDAWVEKDFIDKLVNFYRTNKYIVLSAVEKRYFEEKEFKCNTTIDFLGSPAYFVPTHSRKDKLFYLTVCFFCKKSDYIKTKGVDSDFFMYYEDVDWFWRLSLLGKKFAVANNCYIYHAGAGSSGTGIKYNTFLWRNQNILQALLKNYSTLTLIFVLPLYLIQNFFEILFFLIIFKPKIAYSYIEGLLFNIKNIQRTIKKRRWVQKHRIINDFEVLKKMYLGSGKLLLLKDYLRFA